MKKETISTDGEALEILRREARAGLLLAVLSTATVVAGFLYFALLTAGGAQ